jgi:hypothetical protein
MDRKFKLPNFPAGIPVRVLLTPHATSDKKLGFYRKHPYTGKLQIAKGLGCFR